MHKSNIKSGPKRTNLTIDKLYFLNSLSIISVFSSSCALCIENWKTQILFMCSVWNQPKKTVEAGGQLVTASISPLLLSNESSSNASRCPLVFNQYSQTLSSICCQSKITVHIYAKESMQGGKLTSFLQFCNFSFNPNIKLQQKIHTKMEHLSSGRVLFSY